MHNLKDLYGDVDLFGSTQSVKKAFDSVSTSFNESITMESHADYQLADFKIQQGIRKIFGKSGSVIPSIGGHPDFDYLVGKREQKFGYTVSLFLDIKGSTRLGIIYSPEEVFLMKNTIIKCAIETILAFDGHVHRIMGDAVLAFFRSDGHSPANSAIDAINCGTYIVQFMKQLVLPKLKTNSLDEDIGIRVGVDYGATENVLWGMYGYPGASEITATSFYVDVAAKLQQNAPRNKVMIGDSLKCLLDLHDGIVESKLITENGTRVPDLYISPNYTDGDGKKINYKQFVISSSYFELLPKPEDNNKLIHIESVIKRIKGEPSSDKYFACSRSVSNHSGIEFKAYFDLQSNLDNLTVKFRVENHGKDAAAAPNNGNHEDNVSALKREDGRYFATHWEGTSYVGLHYMYVSVWSGQTKLLSEVCYAVYVGNVNA